MFVKEEMSWKFSFSKFIVGNHIWFDAQYSLDEELSLLESMEKWTYISTSAIYRTARFLWIDFFDKEWLYQHDNASVHKCTTTKTVPDDNDIDV